MEALGLWRSAATGFSPSSMTPSEGITLTGRSPAAGVAEFRLQDIGVTDEKGGDASATDSLQGALHRSGRGVVAAHGVDGDADEAGGRLF